MSASVLTLEDARNANLSIIEEEGKGLQAVHDTVVALQANRRSGTANTKTRGEVAGSNKKLWRQKGTGRARMGERRSPIWTGGGVVFGPRPRSYRKDVTKATRRLAFRKVLSERIREGAVLVTESFDVPDGKTATFVSSLGQFGESPNVLIVGGRFDPPTYLAARNFRPALLMTADEVNVEHLLRYERIVVTADALETLARRTAKQR